VPRPATPARDAHAAQPGADPATGRGLDTHYEQLRHAALHHRAQAFPLGLGVLSGNGVIAWHRIVAGLAPTTRHPAPTPAGGIATTPSPAAAGERALPVDLTGELISILVAITLVPT
jgi:hypothetical protein